MIPKIIWTFWHDNNYPLFVKKCFKSWSKHNPTYKINIITNDNFSNYLDEDINNYKHMDFIQRKSDFIRILLLKKYGGVWIDASILCTGSLDSILDGHKYAGYYLDSFTIDKRYPIIENWFIAAEKNNDFINLWAEEFLKINNYDTIEDYLSYTKSFNLKENISIKNYLTMHVSAQMALQTKNYDISNLYLLKAEDGPYKYLVNGRWDGSKSLNLLCSTNDWSKPIIKFRSHERKLIEQSIDLLQCFENYEKNNHIEKNKNNHIENYNNTSFKISKKLSKRTSIIIVIVSVIIFICIIYFRHHKQSSSFE